MSWWPVVAGWAGLGVLMAKVHRVGTGRSQGFLPQLEVGTLWGAPPPPRSLLNTSEKLSPLPLLEPSSSSCSPTGPESWEHRRDPTGKWQGWASRPGSLILQVHRQALPTLPI